MPSTISLSSPLHFWLRAEVKELEKRTPLLPEHAKELIAQGHTVTVEESSLRCIPIHLFKEVGCHIASEGSWENAPEDAIILGLKEIPDADTPLKHRHIMFGHCYKNQSGWKEFLKRFEAGNGTLWDLEFLVDDNGRRVAAFGRSAGFIGMGVAIKQWCHTQLTGEQLGQLNYYDDSDSLVNEVKAEIVSVFEKNEKKPKVFVIGALGRCGQGAVDFAKRVGIPDEDIIKWDIEETKPGGPFDQILDADIFINCILLTKPIPPFLTMEQLKKPRRLSVMVDVSCDTTNPHNPVPLYSTNTTFLDPTIRVVKGPVFDVISIDHLPSLVPLESSMEFASQLFPHLVQCGASPVWDRSFDLFVQKKNQAEHK